MTGPVCKPFLELVKKVHWYIHETATEIQSTFNNAHIFKKAVTTACPKTYNAYDKRASKEKPAEKKIIFLRHVDIAFNQKIIKSTS